MLELSVAIGANHEEVIWVVAHPWIKMMYLKVRFAVSLVEGEGAKLTFAIVQFSKQDADARRYALVALGGIQKHARARLTC